MFPHGAFMPERNVMVRLHRTDDPTQRAWIAMQVSSCDDPRQVQIDIDPLHGVRSDPTCFLHLPSENEAKVLKSEIVGGVLMARKQLGKIGFRVRLLTLGGSIGDDPRVSQVPSVAFAVGAHVAVVEVIGSEDQRADLKGGFGWRVNAIEPFSEL